MHRDLISGQEYMSPKARQVLTSLETNPLYCLEIATQPDRLVDGTEASLSFEDVLALHIAAQLRVTADRKENKSALNQRWLELAAIERQEGHPRALATYYTWISIDRYHAGSHQGCLIYALKASSADSSFADAWDIQGAALMALRRMDDALNCFDRVLLLDGSRAVSWYNKGTLLQDFGRNREAMDCFTQAVKLKPNYPEAWYNRGVTAEALNLVSEAHTSYERFLKCAASEHSEQIRRAKQVIANL